MHGCLVPVRNKCVSAPCVSCRHWEAIRKWEEAIHLTPDNPVLYEMKSQVRSGRVSPILQHQRTSTPHPPLLSCLGFSFPVCVCYTFPSFSCLAGMLLKWDMWYQRVGHTTEALHSVSTSSRVLAASPVRRPVAFLQSVLLLLLSSSQTRLKSALSFHTRKVVSTGRQSRARYFTLSYPANPIKCFYGSGDSGVCLTAIITLKCNTIFCIAGKLRRNLLKTIRQSDFWCPSNVPSSFLQPEAERGRGTTLWLCVGSSNTECLFVLRMSHLLRWK